MEILRELNEQSEITIILVTHDQEIGRNAKRTLVLRDGLIVEDSEDFDRTLAALHGRKDGHEGPPSPHGKTAAIQTAE